MRSSDRWSVPWPGHWPASRATGSVAGGSPFWVFVAMSIGTVGILYAIGMKGSGTAFPVFFASFLFLFAASGVGNASTFQMIPAIMRKEVARLEPALTAAELVKQSDKESAAIIGFTSAVAAFGAFFIPKSFGTSIAVTGGAEFALYTLSGILRELHCVSRGGSTQDAAGCCSKSSIVAQRCDGQYRRPANRLAHGAVRGAGEPVPRTCCVSGEETDPFVRDFVPPHRGQQDGRDHRDAADPKHDRQDMKREADCYFSHGYTLVLGLADTTPPCVAIA